MPRVRITVLRPDVQALAEGLRRRGEKVSSIAHELGIGVRTASNLVRDVNFRVYRTDLDAATLVVLRASRMFRLPVEQLRRIPSVGYPERALAHARTAVVVALRQHGDFAYPTIAQALGGGLVVNLFNRGRVRAVVQRDARALAEASGLLASLGDRQEAA